MFTVFRATTPDRDLGVRFYYSGNILWVNTLKKTTAKQTNKEKQNKIKQKNPPQNNESNYRNIGTFLTGLPLFFDIF